MNKPTRKAHARFKIQKRKRVVKLAEECRKVIIQIENEGRRPIIQMALLTSTASRFIEEAKMIIRSPFKKVIK